MASVRSANIANRPASWELDPPTWPQAIKTAPLAAPESQAASETVLGSEQAPEFNSAGFQKVNFFDSPGFQQTGFQQGGIQQTGFQPTGFQQTGFQQTGFQDGGLYRSIVKIESRFENEQTGHAIWKIGTGWLIRPDLLVTGGDVVYDAEYQLGATTQVKCYFGYHGQNSTEKIQPRYGKQVFTSSEWDGSDKRSRDIAFIRVADPFTIGAVTSPVEVKNLEPEPVFNIPQPEEKPAEPFVCVIEEQPVVEVAPVEVTPVEEPQVEEVKPVENDVITPAALPEPDVEEFEVIEDVTPPSTVDTNSPVDPFYEVLTAVASLENNSINATTPLLNPIGGLASVTAGALLSYVVEAKTISSGEATKIPGASERALLADASLQAVLAIEESPELDEILDSMKQNWTANAPDAGPVSALLSSYLAEVAPEIATYQAEDLENPADQTTRIKRRALAIRNFAAIENDGDTKDFNKGLFAPTLPLAGREDVFSSVGPVLRSAVSADVQLVTEAGKLAVNEQTAKLLAKLAGEALKSTNTPCDPDDECPGILSNLQAGSLLSANQRNVTTNATLDVLANHRRDDSGALQVSIDMCDPNKCAPILLVHRAIMADAALQALSSLSQEKLDALTLLPLESSVSVQAENVFDFIKRVVQKIGPLALQPAKDAVTRFIPLLLDAPLKIVEEIQPPVAPKTVRTSKSRLALRDMLRGPRPPAKQAL